MASIIAYSLLNPLVCNWLNFSFRSLNSFYFGEGVVVLKELIFNSFYFERVWWS